MGTYVGGILTVLCALLSAGGCASDKRKGDGKADGGVGSVSKEGTKCTRGYTCYDEPNSDVVWVMKNDGNVNGPTCEAVCAAALSQNCSYHTCQGGRPVAGKADFATIAAGLGFTCREGSCWNSQTTGQAAGLHLVSIDTAMDGSKTCYLPTAANISCSQHPGNTNCYGERYATVCPCEPKALDEACNAECPPSHATRAVWTTKGTSCLDRINYWRKRACEEGWVECPPAGLPPMLECTACHECTNSEAETDSKSGAHASFTRCGEHAQGEGGGATCADTIDSFVSERAPDKDGVMRCGGHCAPILEPGCQTFSWGKARSSDFTTLNWGGCDAKKCGDYCSEHPTECFRHPQSPSLACTDPNVGKEPGPQVRCQ